MLLPLLPNGSLKQGGGNVMLVEVKQAKPFLRENVLSVGVV
jgi:hypothetical protein